MDLLSLLFLSVVQLLLQPQQLPPVVDSCALPERLKLSVGCFALDVLLQLLSAGYFSLGCAFGSRGSRMDLCSVGLLPLQVCILQSWCMVACTQLGASKTSLGGICR